MDNLWAFPIASGTPCAITHCTDPHIAKHSFSKDRRLVVSREAPNRDAALATGLVRKP